MAGHKGTTHTLGTCAICWRTNITSYHYRKAHGLIPKELFTYGEKMWRCQKHMVKTPDPHKMMRHYWLEHARSYYKKLPYKTREPYYSKGTPPNSLEKWLTLEEKPMSKKSALKTAEDIDSNQYKETPVEIVKPPTHITTDEYAVGEYIPGWTVSLVSDTSDNQPITAEAIVNAFEKRVIQIDEQLEAKDRTISEQKKTIDETTKALNEVERELLKMHERWGEKLSEEVTLYRKPLEEPTPTKTDGLVRRLFKR